MVGALSLGLLVAGAVSPWVGRAIDRHGGRPVLAASALLLAAGLAVAGLAPNLPVYLFAWVLIGLGMGAGLYDAAFGTLGRYYGDSARSAIATLTLFGGFASTVCWPLSAFLVETLGWRGTCLAYAGLHVFVALPAYLLLLPNAGRTAPASRVAHDDEPVNEGAPRLVGNRRVAFLLLALVITIASAITSVVSVHLLTILQSRGLELAAAVALGALVGPSQVGARAIEMALGRYYHPVWTMIAAMALMAAGIWLMLADLPFMALPLVFYGAGIGIKSIARGTLPLALFGREGYASMMGRLALPALLAQAVSPFVGALLLQFGGPDLVLYALAATAALNVGLVVLLWGVCRPGTAV